MHGPLWTIFDNKYKLLNEEKKKDLEQDILEDMLSEITGEPKLKVYSSKQKIDSLIKHLDLLMWPARREKRRR